MATRAGFVCGVLACVLASGCSADDGGEDEQKKDDLGPNVEGYEVGVAVRDVTPTDAEIGDPAVCGSAGSADLTPERTSCVFMGAYGILRTRGPATGVHDPVYARAMAVASGFEEIVMVILDFPGMSNRFVHDVGAAASAKTGLKPEQILVGSTHTHSAPDFQGVWGGIPNIYRQRVVDLTVQAIAEAWESRKPAKVFVSKGTGQNNNRRAWGITDEDIIVIDAEDMSGQRIGTLVNFAAHPVTLGAGNSLISSDFCGYTVGRMQEELGAPVLYFNGIQGDVSPAGTDPGLSGFARAEAYGHLVADDALAAMPTRTEVTPGLVRTYHPFDHAVTNPAFILMHDLGWLDYDIANVDGALGLTTQVAYLRFGKELQGVVFPGEGLTRLGLAIKDQMTAPFRFWLGLTTDSLGYFVPHDEWRQPGHNDGYEETVSIDEWVGEHARDVIVPAIEEDNGTFTP